MNTADEDVHYLGFWARFVAFLIDSTAASIVLAPLAAAVLGELILSDYDLADPAQLNVLLVKLTTQLSFDLLLMDSRLVDGFRRFGADAYLCKFEFEEHRIVEIIEMALTEPHTTWPTSMRLEKASTGHSRTGSPD